MIVWRDAVADEVEKAGGAADRVDLGADVAPPAGVGGLEFGRDRARESPLARA